MTALAALLVVSAIVNLVLTLVLVGVLRDIAGDRSAPPPDELDPYRTLT